MPITKERLIAVTRAALHCANEIERLSVLIEDLAAQVSNGMTDAERAIEHIANLTSQPDLIIGLKHKAVMMREQIFWNINYRKAERDRRYQERRRRELGVPQAPQAFDLEDVTAISSRAKNVKASADQTFLPYDPGRAKQMNAEHETMLKGMRGAIEVECAGLMTPTHYATAFRDNTLGQYFYGCICDSDLKVLDLAEIKEHLQSEADQQEAEDAFDPTRLTTE